MVFLEDFTGWWNVRGSESLCDLGWVTLSLWILVSPSIKGRRLDRMFPKGFFFFLAFTFWESMKYHLEVRSGKEALVMYFEFIAISLQALYHFIIMSLIDFSHWDSMLILVCVFSRVWLLAVASQASLSMGLSWHEYCSGLQFPSRDLPDTGIEPKALVSPALAGIFFTTEPPGKHQS